ncbi:MAG: indolepyruvate ferredoxin oxidoreductase subunit alpha [Solidesulfovibrio sp. DCME]|uniref:indolepyruvate ferredoxin oxidoreductase subunit alpha n=1 Tax=Solidesulfovibrio sp. DCME TaxID=3447380 RepID=UPI003D1033D5
MSRIAIDEERCKGCLLCAQVCPKAIIAVSSRFNTKGYKVAEVTESGKDTCTGCAACAQMCPDVAIKVWRSVKSTAKEND